MKQHVYFIILLCKLGAVAHACNPSTLGNHEVKRSRPSWSTWWNPVSTKNTKIIQVWWLIPVVPATWEAEAQESLEPRRWRLQWAKIAPLHSSMGQSETPSQQQQKNKIATWKTKPSKIVPKYWTLHINFLLSYNNKNVFTNIRNIFKLKNCFKGLGYRYKCWFMKTSNKYRAAFNYMKNEVSHLFL